jgi:hypothetical protein
MLYLICSLTGEIEMHKFRNKKRLAYWVGL